jgi:SAM-dependent methyltransferase
MIDGITDQLTEELEKNGYRVGMYTGEDKTGFDQFIRGHIDVLIGSSAVGTGVDGLQNVSNQLIMNVLPWTNAEFEQLKGRIYRQGQKRNVEVIIPITTIDFEGETKSWCKDKLERIKFKKTLADASVDGIVPEETLRTEMQVFEDLRKWINRLSDNEIIDFERKDLVSTLFTEDEGEQEKRLRKYGDFSAMNSRWNISNSTKTHDRLKKNSKEWVHYHELYRQSREKWIKTPYKEMIKYYSKRNGLHIGDFGCGEAFLYEALHDKHTVHSFDHVAINENVVEADLASIPLKDESLDVVIFSLALMGRNFDDYIKEAARVLKLDGTLRIIESTNRFNDLEAFKNALYHFGFDDVLSKDMWKFTEIKGLRSDRELSSKLDIKF